MADYNCSTWLKKKIADLSRNQSRLWIRDPDHLLEASEVDTLGDSIDKNKRLLVVKHSLELRLRLAEYGHLPVQWVIIDQSMPVDSGAEYPREVFAPDLKHDLPDKNRKIYTIRDYLVDQTGDPSWPAEVNTFPYRELARHWPVEFLDAYQDFRQGAPRGFSALDLKLIAAGAVLKANLFKLSPLDILRLSGKQGQEQWRLLADFFNEEEIAEVKNYLRKQPPPLGDLFSTTPGVARLATLSLMLLSRHLSASGVSEDPGIYLPNISPTLAQYREAEPVPVPENYPAWLEEEFAETFDKPAHISYLASLLNLEDEDKAEKFLNTNPPSPKLRELARLTLALSGKSTPSIRDTQQTYHGNTLGSLVAEFNQAKQDIEIALAKAVQLEGRLATMPLSKQSIDLFTRGFQQDGIYRLEILIDRLSRCMRGIESKPERNGIPGFENVWLNRKKEATDLQGRADKVLKDLDFRLARLLQDRYNDVVRNKILQTWQVYEQFISPRRRSLDGKLRRAAILIFDGMRYDTWRELIRPRLERNYQIEEDMAMATLPSETKVSRRASFAGLEPARISSNNELELFNELLKRIHHVDPKLTPTEDKGIVPGVAFSFKSRDGLTHGVVFDFPDKSGHAFTWGQELLIQVWNPLLNEVDNWLNRLPEDTDVFVYSDHGHILPGSGRINLPADACIDVGYRSAQLKRKIEGEKARHFVQIPSGDLGHPPGFYFAFPLPDYSFALLDPGTYFRPAERYRHSGISMYELFIPFAHLRPRTRQRHFALQLYPTDIYRVGQDGKIQVELTSDSLVKEVIELVSTTDGITPTKVHNVGPDRQPVTLEFNPAQSGNVEIEVAALVGAERVAITKLSVYVEPSQDREAPPDRILRMFGD